MIQKAKDVKNDAVEFAKNLAHTVVAFSLLALGAYAAYEGHFRAQAAIVSTALLFAGAVNVLVGLGALYRALMHKEA